MRRTECRRTPERREWAGGVGGNANANGSGAVILSLASVLLSPCVSATPASFGSFFWCRMPACFWRLLCVRTLILTHLQSRKAQWMERQAERLDVLFSLTFYPHAQSFLVVILSVFLLRNPGHMKQWLTKTGSKCDKSRRKAVAGVFAVFKRVEKLGPHRHSLLGHRNPHVFSHYGRTTGSYRNVSRSLTPSRSNADRAMGESLICPIDSFSTVYCCEPWQVPRAAAARSGDCQSHFRAS